MQLAAADLAIWLAMRLINKSQFRSGKKQGLAARGQKTVVLQRRFILQSRKFRDMLVPGQKDAENCSCACASVLLAIS